MERWAIILYGLGISGGANVIFEHASYAVEAGVAVTFLTKNDQNEKTASWHEKSDCFTYMNIDDAVGEHFDVVIATEWKSAFDCYSITADKYIYFVQSIESRFFYNQESILSYISNMTYEMDFSYITEATWIKDYLKKKYHKDARLVHNGINKKIFNLEGRKVQTCGTTRFLVEGVTTNWLKNVPRTIEILREAGAKDIGLVTPDDIVEYPGVNKVYSHVPLFEMPNIYRDYDVLVKLSLVEGMFGPPLEMFHCGGTAITYDIEGASEYLVNGYNALVIPKGNEEGVKEAINKLINDKNLLRKLQNNALRTADKWIDWGVSSKSFYSAVLSTHNANEEMVANIVEKGHAGALAYRQAELYLGMDPYKNRIADAVEMATDKKLDIYIYGAGLMCKSTIILFSQYDVRIHGIVVSSKEGNPNNVMGHPVGTMDILDDIKDRALVYISTEKYYDEIRDDLRTKGYPNVI